MEIKGTTHNTMNKTLRNLAITAAAIAACTVGTKAAAEPTPGGDNLWNAIRQTGTTITVDGCAEEGTMGWFSHYPGSYQDMQIQICTNTAETSAERWETLRHEAVHLAQKCENPDHGNTYDTLTTSKWIINKWINKLIIIPLCPSRGSYRDGFAFPL